MTIQYEQRHAGEFLLSEGAGNISREAINVAAGAALGLPSAVLVPADWELLSSDTT